MTDILIKDDGGSTMKAVDMGDLIMPAFKFEPNWTETIKNMPDFEVRDDDIMLCSFHKTGTTWLYEILSMLINRTAKPQGPGAKVNTMLEAVSPDTVNKQPSPRILNTHVPLRYVPRKDMKRKQTKTVLIARNPKDTAVSYFNHMRGLKLYDYADGKWENWIGPYLQGKLELCKYTSYLNEWQQAMEDDSLGFPVHVLYFEDLKTNGLVEIDKLDQFLGLDVEESLKREIIDKCNFDKMLADKKPALEANKENRFNSGFMFLRKATPSIKCLYGQIGDWKNWFTVAQDEMFDEIWKREIRKDSMFHFRYTG